MWGIHQEEIIASFGSVNVDDVVIGCLYKVLWLKMGKGRKDF